MPEGRNRLGCKAILTHKHFSTHTQHTRAIIQSSSIHCQCVALWVPISWVHILHKQIFHCLNLNNSHTICIIYCRLPARRSLMPLTRYALLGDSRLKMSVSTKVIFKIYKIIAFFKPSPSLDSIPIGNVHEGV